MVHFSVEILKAVSVFRGRKSQQPVPELECLRQVFLKHPDQLVFQNLAASLQQLRHEVRNLRIQYLILNGKLGLYLFLDQSAPLFFLLLVELHDVSQFNFDVLLSESVNVFY